MSRHRRESKQAWPEQSCSRSSWASFRWASDAAERLPLLARPISYELEFTPDFEHETFDGRETIAVRIVHPTSHVVLHAVGLTFDRVTIQSGKTTLPAAMELDAANETATLRVGRTLRPGPATIRIAFNGRLNSDLRGSISARRLDVLMRRRSSKPPTRGGCFPASTSRT